MTKSAVPVEKLHSPVPNSSPNPKLVQPVLHT